MIQTHIRKWREEVLSVPNLLSYVRLLLIPAICLSYKKQEYSVTTILVLISGLTDIADGYIARRFDMITDFGKILDPIADKLTQLVLVLLLLDRYPWFLYLVVLLVVKELYMGIMGLVVVYNQKQVHSSIWYGKFSTMVFYCVMVLLLFFPQISEAMAEAMGMLCGGAMMLSLGGYIAYYTKVMLTKKKAKV